MTDNNDKISHLINKLDYLLKRHDDFSKEIDSLRIEINRLKSTEQARSNAKEEFKKEFCRKK